MENNINESEALVYIPKENKVRAAMWDGTNLEEMKKIYNHIELNEADNTLHVDLKTEGELNLVCNIGDYIVLDMITFNVKVIDRHEFSSSYDFVEDVDDEKYISEEKETEVEEVDGNITDSGEDLPE